MENTGFLQEHLVTKVLPQATKAAVENSPHPHSMRKVMQHTSTDMRNATHTLALKFTKPISHGSQREIVTKLIPLRHHKSPAMQTQHSDQSHPTARMTSNTHTCKCGKGIARTHIMQSQSWAHNPRTNDMQSTHHYFRSMHASGRRNKPPTLTTEHHQDLRIQTSAMASATIHELQLRTPKERPASFSDN
eukprot:6461976-Amphidinium_carterae.4